MLKETASPLAPFQVAYSEYDSNYKKKIHKKPLDVQYRYLIDERNIAQRAVDSPELKKEPKVLTRVLAALEACGQLIEAIVKEMDNGK